MPDTFRLAGHEYDLCLCPSISINRGAPCGHRSADCEAERCRSRCFTGEPIIGANVLVKGTTNGTITNVDGEYTLDAPAGATLQISYIGYKSLEVKATSDKQTIKLAEDSETLAEVIVVGYTTQRKESLTGAMNSIKSDKLKDITSPSVENLLNGKAPGVYVAPGSGQPGSTGAVVIRGQASLSGGTAPLWVIDGVIVGSGAGDLNPADI